MVECGNQIFKRKHLRKYLELDRKIINDQKLSLKGKGMMSILLDQKDGWQFYESELVKRSKDGRTSVASALTELEENRYLIRVWLRNKGKYSGRIWVVYEEALTEKEYETEKEKLENEVKESQSKGNLTDFRFSETGESETGESEIGKPATNDTNYNENNSNDNNNNDKALSGSCCRLNEIKKIMEKYKISIWKTEVLKILSEYTDSQLEEICQWLTRKKVSGGIPNPGGYISSHNTKAICDSILTRTMSSKKQNKYNDDYEFYVPPSI